MYLHSSARWKWCGTVGFQGHAAWLSPRGTRLSCLACWNDRAPAFPQRRKAHPQHSLRSKRVCGFSLSLMRSCRPTFTTHARFHVAFLFVGGFFSQNACSLLLKDFHISNRFCPPKMLYWHQGLICALSISPCAEEVWGKSPTSAGLSWVGSKLLCRVTANSLRKKNRFWLCFSPISWLLTPRHYVSYKRSRTIGVFLRNSFHVRDNVISPTGEFIFLEVF